MVEINETEKPTEATVTAEEIRKVKKEILNHLKWKGSKIEIWFFKKVF